jgi:hypothetical protein
MFRVEWLRVVEFAISVPSAFQDIVRTLPSPAGSR